MPPSNGRRSGDKVNRDGAGDGGRRRAQQDSERDALASSIWSDDSGKLTLTFKRPSPIMPATRPDRGTVEITALASPDRPERHRPDDALCLDPDRDSPPTRPMAPSSACPTIPRARKRPSPRATTTRSTRSPRNSRRSAGTPTIRPGSDAASRTDGRHPEAARGTGWPQLPREQRRPPRGRPI
ncbi:MAG: hypothetical protein MZV49_11605 [Rhodopseudomonas palustris]|nr:hypothetical protein [Rhodopseudomonas palustris]